MKRLYVLYDSDCGFCMQCRRWLEAQPAYLELVFLPAGSPWIEEIFPGAKFDLSRSELTVVSDEGAVYVGSEAFIMCLYALVEKREWSLFLARPALLPLARRAFEMISQNRKKLSRWLGLANEMEIARLLGEREEPTCAMGDETCRQRALSVRHVVRRPLPSPSA